jgi:hypothetical protein
MSSSKRGSVSTMRSGSPLQGALKKPLARSRAPEKLPKKEFALFEPAGASLQTPGSFEEGRGPAVGGQVIRAPFLLVRFLWASKENEQL